MKKLLEEGVQNEKKQDILLIAQPSKSINHYFKNFEVLFLKSF